MFFENFQIEKTFESTTLNRPLGPSGSFPISHLLYNDGLGFSMERIAEIASWIQHATLESRSRLSEASSQENTSEVMVSSHSALAYRIPSRSSFESHTISLPEGSVSLTPKS